MVDDGAFATSAPTGVASVVGFGTADEMLASMIATTGARMEAAIAERLWRQSISDRGDAAATLFLDAPRVRALLHGPDDPAPAELATLRQHAERRELGLVRRIEATPAHGPPLARAIQRWQLPAPAIRILCAMISIELTPRLSRLAAFLGGDASRPGVVVEALAALTGAEEDGAVVVARSLAAGGRLHDLALVLMRAPESPLLRRPVWIASRAIELAIGHAVLDDRLGAVRVPAPPPGSGPDDAVRAAILAVVRHPPRPVIGVVRGERGLAPAVLARVLEDEGGALLAVELSSLAEDTRIAGLAREAILHGAAIAVRIDIAARDAVRAAHALDKLAALVPVFVIGADHAPALPMARGVVPIDVAPPTPAALEAAIAGGFAGLLVGDDAARVAASSSFELAAIERAAAAIAAQPFPAQPVGAVIRALADQVAVPDAPNIRLLEPRSVELAPALGAAVDDVVRRWQASPLPRRLRVAIDGRPGTGKSTLAAVIAARLGLSAFAIDGTHAVRGPEHDPALATIVELVQTNSAVLVVENVDLLGTRRGRAPNEPPFTMSWLARVAGLVIVTTRDPMSNMEPALRRDFDLAIAVPFPDLAERSRLWHAMFERRGWSPGAELAALARDFPFTAEQIERVAALAAGDPAALRPEAERRSTMIVGRPSGIEIE